LAEHSTKKIRTGTSLSSVDELAAKAEVPESFGRYQVSRHLASGGMGSVFLARDGVLQREVAIKVIHPTPGLLGKEFSARFLNEARCVASLKHPNIVPIYDLGLESETPYIVMEVVDGPSLSGVIEEGPLTSRQARSLGIQMANALAEAHRAGILHRDLKPANLLRAGVDTWKLVDFGVAHTPDSSLTTVGDFLGTPSYAAPESLSGKGFSPASDVYGLAATLYHALAGAPPHGVGNAVSIALRAAEGPPPSLRIVSPTTALDLVQIIDQCLSSDPTLRPSAAGLAEQLAEARADTLDGLEAQDERAYAAATQVGVANPREPAAGKRWVLPLVLASAAAAVVAISVSGESSKERASEQATAEPPSREEEPAALEEGSASIDAVRAASAAGPQRPTHDTLESAAPAARGEPDDFAETSPDLRDTDKDAEPDAIGTPEAGLTGLDEVHQLIARRAIDPAVRSLDRLRRAHPESAYLPFLQGKLNMRRKYWKDGFAAYRQAIANNPGYREHPTLIGDAIRSLYSKSQPWRGATFLREQVGAAAVPALTQALSKAANPRVKSRMQQLLKQLDK
jgi:eukaryotic-like serine/threonine-protein kinase